MSLVVTATMKEDAAYARALRLQLEGQRLFRGAHAVGFLRGRQIHVVFDRRTRVVELRLLSLKRIESVEVEYKDIPKILRFFLRKILYSS